MVVTKGTGADGDLEMGSPYCIELDSVQVSEEIRRAWKCSFTGAIRFNELIPSSSDPHYVVDWSCPFSVASMLLHLNEFRLPCARPTRAEHGSLESE
jgi:hypothetical protein